MSASAFVLVDAILPIGNHTISEYLRIFNLLAASVSGSIAIRTARTNARGELDKIQRQIDAQQAVLEKGKIAELRQSYLTPLRYYAQALSRRLLELEMKFQSAENDTVRAWFKVAKDQVTRDKRREDYEAWCYYEGIFSVSTLYYTCSYFYCARSIRFYRPFGESRPAYSEALEAFLVRVTEAFGDATVQVSGIRRRKLLVSDSLGTGRP